VGLPSSFDILAPFLSYACWAYTSFSSGGGVSTALVWNFAGRTGGGAVYWGLVHGLDTFFTGGAFGGFF